MSGFFTGASRNPSVPELTSNAFSRFSPCIVPTSRSFYRSIWFNALNRHYSSTTHQMRQTVGINISFRATVLSYKYHMGKFSTVYLDGTGSLPSRPNFTKTVAHSVGQ